MKIFVKVHPKSKQEKIEKISEGDFEVYFNVPPEAGKANKKMIEMLAEYFGVPISNVYITSGSHSRKKWVQIIE